jgi:hypothetical protein
MHAGWKAVSTEPVDGGRVVGLAHSPAILPRHREHSAQRARAELATPVRFELHGCGRHRRGHPFEALLPPRALRSTAIERRRACCSSSSSSIRRSARCSTSHWPRSGASPARPRAPQRREPLPSVAVPVHRASLRFTPLRSTSLDGPSTRRSARDPSFERHRAQNSPGLGPLARPPTAVA